MEQNSLLEKASPIGSSQYYARLFVTQREALATFDALVQEIQQIPVIIKEPSLALIKLNWWAQEVAGMFTNPPTASHPLTQALLRSHVPLGLAKNWQDLIASVQITVEQNRFFTHTEAIQYFEQLGGSIALIITAMSGNHEYEYNENQIKRVGQALAYGEYIANLALHCSNGMIYIGLDLIKEFDLTVANILNQQHSEKLAQLQEHLITQWSTILNDNLHPQHPIYLSTMARLELTTLAEVRTQKLNLFQQEIQPAPIKKLLLAWWTKVRHGKNVVKALRKFLK